MLVRKKFPILNEQERNGMRAAGKFNAKLMDFLRPHVQPGVTTAEIDDLVVKFTADHGYTAACLGYGGPANPFPKSCCTSINEVICHGIPGPRRLVDGDIVNVDITTIVDGWHGDQSETFLIGEVDPVAKSVVQCAFDSLYIGIEALKPNCTVSAIGQAIVAHAKPYGFGVVEKYVGHGIGRKFHHGPNIPHVPTYESKKQHLVPGMCFTIEPMINGGTHASVEDPGDGWTVRTADGKVSAQFEHTILMTEDGPELLTLTNDGPRPGHQF